MSKEAMKLALGKIKSARDCHPNAVDALLFEAEEILEGALAQQPAQQEPVAWMAYVRKVRDALEPEDWCGDERMIDVLDRALAQKPCCLNMAAGKSCLADPRPNCPLLAAAPQPARPYRLLQDNGSKYFGDSWDKAEQPAPAQQCMDHGECFGGKCIYPAPQPAQQQEVEAFCDPSDPDPKTAFAWPGLDRGSKHTAPLYTSPPADRKPLPPSDVVAMWHEARPAHAMNNAFDWYKRGVEDAEAAHNIKEKS